MITLKEAPFAREEVAHIVRNLRARDRAEIFALRWDDDEARFVQEICIVCGPMWRMFCYDAEPVAMAGVLPVRPGVVAAGAYGTDLWPRVVRPITRFALDWSIPRLKCAGYHRAESYVLASNRDSQQWLELLGASLEARLWQFGRQQEDFLLYVWRLQDVHGRQWRRQRAANGSIPGTASTAANRRATSLN